MEIYIRSIMSINNITNFDSKSKTCLSVKRICKVISIGQLSSALEGKGFPFDIQSPIQTHLRTLNSDLVRVQKFTESYYLPRKGGSQKGEYKEIIQITHPDEEKKAILQRTYIHVLPISEVLY